MSPCGRAEVSWGVAFFEYMLQVPANRIGFTVLSLAQLKILQEVITLAVFVPFAVLYMKQPMKLDFVWAGLCLVGAAYFYVPGVKRRGRPRSNAAPAPSRSAGPTPRSPRTGAQGHRRRSGRRA